MFYLSNLKKNPKDIFEKSIQIQIEKLIFERFEKDKKLVIQKTEDISKLVNSFPVIPLTILISKSSQKITNG